jgi:hypothetical protein
MIAAARTSWGARLDGHFEVTTLDYLYLAGELDAESLPRRRTVR